ncbi:hypothetical protein HAX54_046570, partial [Datura stramonium]|nr:hypothetical protein [Datura stramonium]
GNLTRAAVSDADFRVERIPFAEVDQMMRNFCYQVLNLHVQGQIASSKPELLEISFDDMTNLLENQ